jgi:hypothetical protein
MSQFQNSVNFGTGSRKSGLKPAFSIKSKVAVPKLKFWNSLKYEKGIAEYRSAVRVDRNCYLCVFELIFFG